MKRISALVLGLVLAAASVSFADSPQGNFVLGVNGVVGVPTSSNVANEVNVGFGGEGFIGYAFDKQFTLGVDSGYNTYSLSTNYVLKQLGIPSLPPGVTVSGSLSYVPIIAEAKYAFSATGVKPYVLLGAGLALNSGSFTVTATGASATGTISETDLLIAPGIGVAFPVSDKVDIFVQGRVDLDFTNNNNSTPATITFNPGGSSSGNTNYTGDNPTIYIPFAVGADFNL